LRFELEQQETEQAEAFTPEAYLFGMRVEPNMIRRLKRKDPSIFLMTELELPATRRSFTAGEWAAWVRPVVEEHFQSGVGYFAGLPAPNLVSRGLGLHWATGKDFGKWWAQAVNELKSSFPSAKFGFPALSPGSQIAGQRLDADAFMEAADEIMYSSDWLGASCYWDDPRHMDDEGEGGYFAKLRRYFPDQLIFITEFGNLSSTHGQSTKLSEAKRYYENLEKQPGIGAAFIHI
jgi:hypothetical protein